MVLEYDHKNVAEMYRTYEQFVHNRNMLEITSEEDVKHYAEEVLFSMEKIEADFPHGLRLELGLERTVLDDLKKKVKMRKRLCSL